MVLGLVRKRMTQMAPPYRLAQHGGNGSTLYAHAQPKDEDGVQHDVDDRADNGGQHTDLGKGLRSDEQGAHAKHDPTQMPRM